MELIIIVLTLLGINLLIARLIIFLIKSGCIKIVKKYNTDEHFRIVITEDVYSYAYDICFKRRKIDDYLIFHFPILNIFLLLFVSVIHISFLFMRNDD
jgi:hypothetical protein